MLTQITSLGKFKILQSIAGPKLAIFSLSFSSTHSHGAIWSAAINDRAIDVGCDGVELLGPRRICTAVQIGPRKLHTGPAEVREKLVARQIDRKARAELLIALVTAVEI